MVEATDADSGDNGRLQMMIVDDQHSGDGFFTVDQDTGSVRLSSSSSQPDMDQVNFKVREK